MEDGGVDKEEEVSCMEMVWLSGTLLVDSYIILKVTRTDIDVGNIIL